VIKLFVEKALKPYRKTMLCRLKDNLTHTETTRNRKSGDVAVSLLELRDQQKVVYGNFL